MRTQQGFSTCYNIFPCSEVLSMSRTIRKHTWCCRSAAPYLKAPLQATDIAALSQSCLHGVDDHVAHACPRAL